jgi:hypothetical protein
MKGWDALDEAAERAGGYLAFPNGPSVMDYDYHEMAKYAAKKGVTSMELTEEELKLFEFDPPLVYD